MHNCLTPDCPCVFVAACSSDFKCPTCTKHYCLDCKVPYHDGMTCDEYRKAFKPEEGFMELMKEQKMK